MVDSMFPQQKERQSRNHLGHGIKHKSMHQAVFRSCEDFSVLNQELAAENNG